MSVISRMIDEDKKHKYNENEKCPICGKKFDNMWRDVISHGVVEEVRECEEDHYYYYYGYGGTQYIINGEEITWHYTDDKEEVGDKMKKVRNLIEEEKRKEVKNDN